MALRSVTIAALLLLLGCATVPATAWWCTGHMIIGEIARRHLHDGVEDKVNKYVRFMHEHGPFPESPDMVQAACWADDLKSQGLRAMAQWHFINQPYDPSQFPLPKSSELQKDNVATEITDMQKAGRDYKSKRIQWNMAFALMNLLHFYGDIHQPLHATELYSSQFPKGDLGGNLFDVTVQGVQWKLHNIWDSVCTQYQTRIERPMSPSNVQLIQTLAQEFQANYTVSPAMRAVYNSTVMAQEGLEYAAKYAYANVQPGGAITSEYLANCRPAAGQRIAQAGWRLASELNYIFQDGNHEARLLELPKRLNERREAFLKGRHGITRN